VIVVIGLPAWASNPDGEGNAAGTAVDVVAAARTAGATVELAGKVGDDGAGDAVVVALGRLGIGHAALLRDPARPTPVVVAAEEAGDEGRDAVGDAGAETVPAAAGRPARLLPEDPSERPGLEAGDVELALRYLDAASVIVLAESLGAAAVEAAAGAASFAGAKLVVLVAPGSTAPAAPDAIVLEAPAEDDGSFGRLVGAFAARLDGGADPSAAFRQALGSSGWERVG
jgi:sugar/nucleoside kinase (ribokinase family)